MRKNQITEIYEAYKAKSINFETAMSDLAAVGVCPNLLNDDAGRWAMAFDGYQTLNTTKRPIDITTSFMVEKKYWKKTIREALIFALETDLF